MDDETLLEVLLLRVSIKTLKAEMVAIMREGDGSFGDRLAQVKPLQQQHLRLYRELQSHAMLMADYIAEAEGKRWPGGRLA